MYRYLLERVFRTLFLVLLCATGTLQAQENCSFEAIGTTVPNTSGTPLIINSLSGTVISANFFASGAIDPPFFDGGEFVSVCILEPDQNGRTIATLTTDVGLDDDTQIKAYPQFLVGSKFGNQSETSFRFYSNTGLPAEQQWPVIAENLNDASSNFEFANLEYVSNIRGVDLPAFTNNLPEIEITLDIDEQNVVGAERDVMLESWFYDTAANSDLIGINLTTGASVVNTLNNIVGIGHRHYPELDNTLLEMMVHIGSLSPNDVSRATRNPGQNQLTENFSGKDSDGDGIDDHFDVDSHVNLNNNLDPQPGIYSSGLDQNGDGIDDADLLPVKIGSFLYSIWYGESFLSPIVIFSRETNSSLENDFNLSTPDMNLSAEGEFTLPWNEFLEYTMNELQPKLQAINVEWASGSGNLFSRISSPFGAIGGVELGVEPQINGFSDVPYTATINKFDVQINGKEFGLSDVRIPFAQATSPSSSEDVTPGVIEISGSSSDDQSGINSVGVRIQQLGTTPSLFWDGSSFTETPIFHEANLSSDGASWTLPGVTLDSIGRYRVRVIAHDKAGNISQAFENPETDFLVIPPDTTDPSAQATTPDSGNFITVPETIDITGTAFDAESGVSSVGVRIQQLGTTPAMFWDGSSFSNTSIFHDALLSGDGTSWTLSGVALVTVGRYRIRVIARDKAGNISQAFENPETDFLVNSADTTDPSAQATTPDNGNFITAPETIDITGTAFDAESGVSSVRVRIQQLGTTPALFWNGSSFTDTSIFLETNLSSDGNFWTLPGITLDTAGRYRVRVIVNDNAGNVAQASDNPKTDFEVQ